MVIYFIRHPKTEAPDGVCYGSSNVLPGVGELDKVVSSVKEKIAITADTVFVSSPLSRCTLLAEALAQGEKISTDSRIQELDFGEWELQAWNAIPEEEMKLWSADFVNKKPPHGESFAEVVERVRYFWKDLLKSGDESKIVCTHSGVLRALLVIILEASPYKVFNTEVDYGDVIRIEVLGDDYVKLKFL